MLPTTTRRAFTRHQMTRHLEDYCWSAEVRGSFQKTAPRKTAENNAKHRDGGVGSVAANHDGGRNNTNMVYSWSKSLRLKGGESL